MSGRYKTYPEYKESGVEWLDCLPSHWETVALKMLIDVRDGTHDTPAYVEPSESSYPLVTSKDVTGGEINLTSCKQISEEDYNSIIKRSAVSIGDILMPMIGTVGLPILIESNSSIAIKNLALFKTSLEKNQLDTKYLLYFLNSNECTLQFSLESRGGVQNFVSLGTLRNLGLPFVSLSEQQKIANFLDHETTKIDTLIAKQEKLIKLLKEKRQAVISHAVTKGLNPKAPMKDSCVEWLGQVPEHWLVTRLKFECEVVDCRNKTPEYFEDGDYFVVRTTNVKNQKLNFNGALYTNKINFDIWTQRGVPPKGSILFTREAPTGEVCIVPDNLKFCMGQRMMNFIANDETYTNYLFDYLISDCLDRYINSVSHGSTVSHLRVEQVENIPILVPPAEEVVAIHDYIKVMKLKYDGLEYSALKAIELMQERRTALISAAVTGKIDVRNWERPND